MSNDAVWLQQYRRKYIASYCHKRVGGSWHKRTWFLTIIYSDVQSGLKLYPRCRGGHRPAIPQWSIGHGLQQNNNSGTSFKHHGNFKGKRQHPPQKKYSFMLFCKEFSYSTHHQALNPQPPSSTTIRPPPSVEIPVAKAWRDSRQSTNDAGWWVSSLKVVWNSNGRSSGDRCTWP